MLSLILLVYARWTVTIFWWVGRLQISIIISVTGLCPFMWGDWRSRYYSHWLCSCGVTDDHGTIHTDFVPVGWLTIMVLFTLTLFLWGGWRSRYYSHWLCLFLWGNWRSRYYHTDFVCSCGVTDDHGTLHTDFVWCLQYYTTRLWLLSWGGWCHESVHADVVHHRRAIRTASANNQESDSWTMDPNRPNRVAQRRWLHTAILTDVRSLAVDRSNRTTLGTLLRPFKQLTHTRNFERC